VIVGTIDQFEARSMSGPILTPRYPNSVAILGIVNGLVTE